LIEKVRVNTNALKKLANKCNEIDNNLITMLTNIDYAKNSLDWKIPSKDNFENKLSDIRKNIVKLSNITSDMTHYINGTVYTFNITDKKFSNRIAKIAETENSHKSYVKSSYTSKELEYGGDQFGYKKKDLGSIESKNGAPKKNEYDNTFSVGDSYTLADGALKEDEYIGAYGNAGYQVGAYSAHASYEGDLKNGVFAASVGGSVSAVAGSASLNFGNDYVSSETKVEGSVLTAEAELGANLDITSGNVNVTGEAGAYLVEGTASQTVNVLGVEGTASATGYVGVGADFTAGFDDGKIKFEAGAALGIGGKVGFEVGVPDLSDAYDKTSSAVSALGDKLTFWD
jgi:hypothetical protein